MSIFNIFARLTLDDAKFQTGMKRAESSVAALGKMVGRYFTAGAIGYGLVNLGRQAFHAAGEIQDLSEQLGITTDEVQALQKAARESGLDFNKYAEAIVRIKKAQADALSGNKNAKKMFKTLGVSPRANVIDILNATGRADSPSELAAAYDLIGTKAGKILDSLKTLHALGPSELISKESAAALDQAGDTLAQIKNDLLVIAANSTQSEIGYWAQVFKKANQINPRTGRPYGIGAATYLVTARGMGDSQINRSYPALPLPDKPGGDLTNQNEEGDIEWWNAMNAKDRAKVMADNPLVPAAFTSSNPDALANKGGFFLGADATSKGDLMKQQVNYAKLTAERLDKIEKKLADIGKDID